MLRLCRAYPAKNVASPEINSASAALGRPPAAPNLVRPPRWGPTFLAPIRCVKRRGRCVAKVSGTPRPRRGE
eukprot:10585771-Alexandrium_andersonii.AAC.1